MIHTATMLKNDMILRISGDLRNLYGQPDVVVRLQRAKQSNDYVMCKAKGSSINVLDKDG